MEAVSSKLKREVGSWVWLVRSNGTVIPIRITRVLQSCVECDGVKYNLREGDTYGGLRGSNYKTPYVTLENLQEKYEHLVLEQRRRTLLRDIKTTLDKTKPSIAQLDKVLSILRGD